MTTNDHLVAPPAFDLELALETEPELVVALERNRGWLSLVGHIRKKQAGKERVLVHAILKSKEPVDQRKIDYDRGYMDALDWMVGLPERMKAKLKEEGETDAQ